MAQIADGLCAFCSLDISHNSLRFQVGDGKDVEFKSIFKWNTFLGSITIKSITLCSINDFLSYLQK